MLDMRKIRWCRMMTTTFLGSKKTEFYCCWELMMSLKPKTTSSSKGTKDPSSNFTWVVNIATRIMRSLAKIA